MEVKDSYECFEPNLAEFNKEPNKNLFKNLNSK